jgi:hypothetical protein
MSAHGMLSLPNYNPDINMLIKNAEIINGLAFTRLTDVIDFKRALGRPKDLVDIDLIRKRLM